MIIAREEFLASLIGLPWMAGAKGPYHFDCWHLCQYVKRYLYNDPLPDMEVPPNPTWPWLIDQFKNHPEAIKWHEVPFLHNIVTAHDGSIVLMARHKQPAHCGLWMAVERKILHADETLGVMFQDVLSLKADGWAKLRFFERYEAY